MPHRPELMFHTHCICGPNNCSCPLRLDNQTHFTTDSCIDVPSIEHTNKMTNQRQLSNKNSNLEIFMNIVNTDRLFTKSNARTTNIINKLSLTQLKHQKMLLICLICLFLTRYQPVQGDNQVAPFVSYTNNNMHSIVSPGPSLCPLVPACRCKWSNGKEEALCERKNLATIPAHLPVGTQVLDLSGNHLNLLPAKIFLDKHLNSLQRLLLSECKISFIADEAFEHLTNLIELDLSQNFLQQIPTKALEPSRFSLRRLNLARNPLLTIESNAFPDLPNLNTLDLSNCSLSQLKPDAFVGLNQLSELKLNDNRLIQLPMNVIGSLKESLAIDLFANPWHCDCELRQSIDWMTRHRIHQQVVPTCATPLRHKDIRWINIKAEDFMCPPVVINKQNDIDVGAGSNISLSCTARGSSPLTFVWFQDERNLTTVRANQSEPPPSTKLLEEKRYEIAEEIGPNMTTSILYLMNLKLTDSSLFLCWVENQAGYTIANFSLTVNDSPPAQFEAGGAIGSAGFDGSPWLRLLGLSGQTELQAIIMIIMFIFIFVSVIMVLIMVLRVGYANSSRNSQSSDIKPPKTNLNNHNGNSNNHHPTLSSSGKFSVIKHNRSIRSDSEDNDDDDGEHDADSVGRSSSSSNSSCRKNSSKIMAVKDLDGFIEHMRSGIINMDYHAMSPVIQFNSNSNKDHQQQQQMTNAQLIGQQTMSMNHFPSASNTSSLPYYGNGSSSMATTMSDLSPSSGSGSNTNFITTSNTNATIDGVPSVSATLSHQKATISNCDQLQQQRNHHHHQFAHHPDHLTPATNTTTTSYTSDYHSGYNEDPTINILSQQGVFYDGSYNGPMYNANMYNPQIRPNQMVSSNGQQQHLVPPGGTNLVFQEHLAQQQQVAGRASSQRIRLDHSGFPIL